MYIARSEVMRACSVLKLLHVFFLVAVSHKQYLQRYAYVQYSLK